LPLAVIHGLVTVSTPGPVQNTYSTEQVQVQDYWDRIIKTETTVKSVIQPSTELVWSAMLFVHGYGHEMEGSRCRPYPRFHPSSAAKGWKGHLFFSTSRACRGARCGISGLKASVRHATFWQVSEHHMVELAREPRFPEGRIRGCYLEEKGQGWQHYDDDDVFYLFLQKQKSAQKYIPQGYFPPYEAV
jgi:hypothetical protein